MTGKAYYWTAFEEAAERLKEMGHTPISPCDLPAGLGEDEYMLLDHMLIMMCDGIYMLKDWPMSKGAMIEYEVALHAGKAIYFEGDEHSEKELAHGKPSTVKFTPFNEAQQK